MGSDPDADDDIVFFSYLREDEAPKRHAFARKIAWHVEGSQLALWELTTPENLSDAASPRELQRRLTVAEKRIDLISSAVFEKSMGLLARSVGEFDVELVHPRISSRKPEGWTSVRQRLERKLENARGALDSSLAMQVETPLCVGLGEAYGYCASLRDSLRDLRERYRTDRSSEGRERFFHFQYIVQALTFTDLDELTMTQLEALSEAVEIATREVVDKASYRQLKRLLARAGFSELP